MGGIRRNEPGPPPCSRTAPVRVCGRAASCLLQNGGEKIAPCSKRIDQSPPASRLPIEGAGGIRQPAASRGELSPARRGHFADRGLDGHRPRGPPLTHL